MDLYINSRHRVSLCWAREGHWTRSYRVCTL